MDKETAQALLYLNETLRVTNARITTLETLFTAICEKIADRLQPLMDINTKATESEGTNDNR